jgi:hypothetical protein
VPSGEAQESRLALTCCWEDADKSKVPRERYLREAPCLRRRVQLASNDYVENGDDEKRDGQANRDIEECAFYASSRLVNGSIRTPEYVSHTAASDLEEDDDDQRDADDDLSYV